MPHSLDKLLVDARMAIDLIQSFVDGVTYEQFIRDPEKRSAVQMQCIVIGEVLARMRAAFPAAFEGITEGRKIIDFRNIIAHGYDMVSDDLVWDVVANHLSLLHAELEALESHG